MKDEFTRCEKCKRRIKDYPFKCAYCKKVFCDNHHVPEEHNCGSLNRINKKKKKDWKNAFKKSKEEEHKLFDLDKMIKETDIYNEPKPYSPVYFTRTNEKSWKPNIKLPSSSTIITILCILFVVWFFWGFWDYEETSFIDGEDKYNSNYLHWNHMPLTYNYNQGCVDWWDGFYVEKIKKALDYIKNKTENSISFEWTNSSGADIKYICDLDPHDYKNKESTGGLYGYVYTSAEASITTYSNLITSAEVNLYSPKKSYCDRPVTIIHETLHTVDLDHTPEDSTYKNDIMYPEWTGCFAEISQKDIDYLKGIYGARF